MAAARISLTGSARKTANTLSDKKSGQDKDQRDQQDQFSQACKKQTDLCLSECHKTLLAAYTPGKQETAREDFNNSRNYV